MVFNYFLLAILFYEVFFFFFLIIDLYFLIPVVFTQIFNPTAQLAIPIEISTNKAKEEIEIQLVIVENQISYCLM